MFPKKAVASVTGIGGMAGGIGGIVITKISGWLFDGYRSAGIARSWIEAQAANLGEYLEKIKALTLVNKHNDIINLDKTEIGSLPAEVIQQLQSVDPGMFEQLKSLQAPIVQGNMTIAYTMVFAFCALAYLIAWAVMHFLVPRFRKIDI
jgi:ACS family hexuronate transporter-like MFS transporter